MSGLEKKAIWIGRVRFAMRFLLAIIIMVLSVILFENIFVKSLFFLFGIGLILYKTPYYLFYHSVPIEKLSTLSNKELDECWIKNGAIHLDPSENLVKGFAKFGGKYFQCGVQFSEKGIKIQFLSLPIRNVMFFEWSSFAEIQPGTIAKHGHTQEIAICKFYQSDENLIIPWDSNDHFLKSDFVK